VIIYQKPAILTKQAIVLVNLEFGGYNGAHPIVSVSHTAVQPANHVDAIPKEICAGGNPANATKATTIALLSRL
jgi:hypothetical protein